MLRDPVIALCQHQNCSEMLTVKIPKK